MDSVQIVEAQGLPIAVENDYLNGNQRHVFSAAGDETAIGGQEADHPLPGLWANIDDRLGLVCSLGQGLLYRSAGKPNRPGAREDLLIGSHSQGPHFFGRGEIVAERAGLVMLDSSRAETAAAAASTRVDRTGGTITLAFTPPDAQKHTLRLEADGTAEWYGVSMRPAAEPPPVVPGR